MIERVFLQTHELERILLTIKDVTVCLLGDVCVDVYWRCDMRKSELSRETPHHPLPVVDERVSLGAGGNVAAVMCDLGARVLPVSVVGHDWRGQLLRAGFEQRGICQDYLVTCEDRVTPAYCKPLRMGISAVAYEDPRLDFENWRGLSADHETRLIDALRRASAQADVIAVADQFRFGAVTDALRSALSGLHKPVVVDSRDRVTAFSGMMVKPNEIEAAAAVGVSGEAKVNADNFAQVALALSSQMGAPAIVTLGNQGALWTDGGMVSHAPGLIVPPPVDIVGAGDAFLGAFCCALVAGAPGPKAVAFANIAAAVTVRKIGTTGTATPDEIRSAFREGEWQHGD